MRSLPILEWNPESTRRWLHDVLSRTGAFLVILLALGCFEDPVTERVEIDFVGPDEIRLTTTVELDYGVAGDNRAARGRLGHVAETLLEGSDEWTRRYESIEPVEESFSWIKDQGLLARVERVAVVDTDNLGRFFSDTSLSVFYSEDLDWAEFAIYPGTSNRATREQRNAMVERLSVWTDHLELYYREVERTFAWTARHPERARTVFGTIFRDEISEEELALLDELSEHEIEIVERLEEAMLAAAGVLVVDDNEAYSINEVSELVYDPFPADLEIRLPGRVIDVEGFEALDDSTLTVRRVGLWTALESMRERFVSPDPLTTIIGLAETRSDFDLAAWLSSPKVIHSSPSAHEILEAVEHELVPKDVYRVRWRI